jgi:hypothetical protein
MTVIHESAEYLRAIEAIDREFAKIPPPVAPDVRPAADELHEPELDPVPAHRTAVENAAAVVAAIGLALPFLPL